MYENPFYEPYWVSEEELEHFGVKGMKWGIRRYQNADGTLTEAGKKKLEKYKTKEYTRVSKLKDKAITNYERASYKRKSKGLSIESKNEAVKKSIKETYEKELKMIKTMKYKDMQSDKKAVGDQFLKASVGTTLMTVGINTLTPAGTIGYGLYFGPVLPRSISNAKTRNRMKRYEKEQKNK